MVCSSCIHELEHVQTCLRACVCLTQHLSNMLLPFQELNCHYSYISTGIQNFFRTFLGTLCLNLATECITLKYDRVKYI
jgi:hypothetical protein